MKTNNYRSLSRDTVAAFAGRAHIACATAVVIATSSHGGKVYELTGLATDTPADLVEKVCTLSGETDIYNPVGWEDLAEDYRDRGMPEGFVPMALMLEKLIVSNAPAKVSDDIIELAGEPPQNLTWIVRRALA